MHPPPKQKAFFLICIIYRPGHSGFLCVQRCVSQKGNIPQSKKTPKYAHGPILNICLMWADGLTKDQSQLQYLESLQAFLLMHCLVTLSPSRCIGFYTGICRTQMQPPVLILCSPTFSLFYRRLQNNQGLWDGRKCFTRPHQLGILGEKRMEALPLIWESWATR